jgi:hypothetical protein
MTRAHIPAALRRLVAERARQRCEYCRFPQAASFYAFEVEHIIAEKHGGATNADNLALACPYCNRHKGTDLASIDPDTGALTPFFNSRSDLWDEHFVVHSGTIVPLTAAARVTVGILQLDHPDRMLEREALIRIDRYP